MNLFDLTNQPTGLILGEYAGTPLYSVEDNYTYQYSTNTGFIQRTSSGVETIKYSTESTSTEANNIYQVTFDISLSQQPDTLGTESKIEFQTTIDNSIGVTFFELSYDDLNQLNVGNQSTSFTTQYTATLSGESILQIKATEVGFYIQNIQVENLGVEEPEEETLTPGGGTEFVYWKVCLCDSTSADSYGSFKDDFEQWVSDTEYSNSEGFDLYASGFSEIPEGVYPSNCIGSMHASVQLALKYDMEEVIPKLVHDPQLCVFGGMELNPDKENLIGLTWSDFAEAIEEKNIFGLETGLTEVEMQYVFFNKSGHSLYSTYPTQYDMMYEDNDDLKIKLAYNFNAEKTTEYNPPLKFYNTGDVDEYNGTDWPYKSFSYTYNPDLGIDNPNGYEYLNINFQDDVPPPTWEGEKYTTSENIYPIYEYGSNTPNVDDKIPVFVSEWDGERQVVDEDNFGEVHTTVFPGKCPPQFIGEQDLDGKFGRQTLLGFGPTMCNDSHFDAILESWLEDDDKSSPKIKPSQPTGNTTIETNPDANNIEIPILANFPDNDTYNFIKDAYDAKMIEFFGESPYTKQLKIKIKQEDIRHFATVSYVDNDGNLIDSMDLSDSNSDIHLIVNLNDITVATVNETISGDTFREQYGKILFTPAEALFDVEAKISYGVSHNFSNSDFTNPLYDNYYKGPTYDEDNGSYPNGYDGIKLYNYGNMFEAKYFSESYGGESWFNSHFIHLWSIASPFMDDTGEDRFVEAQYIYWIDGSTSSSPTNENYPNYYWSYEFDEQRGIQPGISYPNSWHWSNNYNLYYRYSGQDKSYWKYDNPTLSTQRDDFLIDEYLNIMQLFDYSFAEDWYNDDGFGGTIENAQVLSHTPWPEQVIESWDSDFKMNFDYDNLEKNNMFEVFNGKFGSDTEQDIYITGTVQYSGDFGVPGFDIDLNPSLDKSYDPYSGIDVRPEIIDENICQHIELMTRQNLGYGPNDGVFYKAAFYPVDDEDVKAITCDTNINFNIYPATKMRARCGDGSTVLMGDTGLGDTLDYPLDLFFSSGIDACTYASNHIRSYPNNKQFHFGVDLDKRPSLGLFYYEEDNQASENFTGNIGNQFQQYPNTNLVTNGNGSVVETRDTYFADENVPDSYLAAGWLSGFMLGAYNHGGDGTEDDDVIYMFRETGTIDYEGYKDYGQEANETIDQFIQSPDFNPNLGYYRFVGYETYSHMATPYEEYYYKEWKPRWIFEETDYEYKGDTHDNSDNWGEAGKIEIDSDGFIEEEYIYASGTHPKCHSAGKCLNFNANKSMINASWNKAWLSDGALESGTSFAPYIHLNQWQRILTEGQATQLFYHDTQSMPDLKVSFWMYTSSDGVTGMNFIEPLASGAEVNNHEGHLDSGESYGDLYNPEFPEIEIAVVKGNPHTQTNRYHPKAALSSLSNDDNRAASGRFKNTVLDEWERFEFSFNLEYDRFYDNESRKFSELNLLVQYSGLEVLNINADTPEERYKVIPGNVYLDDFSVTETGEFIPDVDVRAKKGEGNYGVGSLMEYYDPMIENQLEYYNDTTAPLEAQFYFYARFFNEQVFDREEGLTYRFGNDATFRNELVANDFRRGRFYLYDVDFGDGSPKEFTDEPLRLGNNVAVYHTYTKSGIYEISGYMLRTRPTKNEDGTPNHNEPVGVLHNKKFTVRINVNEGLDEDFEYFGSEDGFSYIPYKNISPVIGGISEESSYYKAIKRQLGFVGNECRQVEFSLRSDQTPPGDDEFYLAQDYPYFDENVIPNFDGDLSNIGCDFNFYSIRGGGTPNHIKNVSFMRALCGDGTYALIGDADGKVMEMGATPDGDGNWTDFFHLTGNEACGGTKTSIYFEKQSDKLKTEIALSKMDSSLNHQFEILPEFQIPRYSGPDENGELIYGGITTSEDELGKALGNVDLTNVRFFNEPKEIYQMFGFTCDNNLTSIDLIPLGKPEYGLNYSNHASTFTNVNDIQSPYFSNVSKVVNSDANGNLLDGGGTPDNSEANPIRFGHDFRIDNIEGLGSGQWNHIDGAFVDTAAFNTPDLGYNQTYTYSTHIYIPFGHCEDGRPCSAADNDYTVMCSECSGTQQYDENADFNVRIVQNMNDDQIGINDWAHDLWHDDIVGGEWANVHDLGTSYGGGNETSFKFKQFDAFNHCHPKGVNNPRFKYAWGNGEVFPIRDSDYCRDLDYSECALINSSGEADGCYWEGDENSGTCKAANLTNNAGPPFNLTCWRATTEGACVDGCEWYGDGSNNSNYETAISIPHEEIITDEWFRLDFPFTTEEPSEYGNHISLRFDTHLGINRINLFYPEVTGDNLVTQGDFTESEGPNLDEDFLADLPFPICFEEYDYTDDGILNPLDAVGWGQQGRPDIGIAISDIITGGLSDEELVEALGGSCVEIDQVGTIAIDIATNQCVGLNGGTDAWSTCEDCYDTSLVDYTWYGPEAQTPLDCCNSIPGFDDTQFTEECEQHPNGNFIKSHKCLYELGSTARPIDEFINPTADEVAEVESWELYGGSNIDTNQDNLHIHFNEPPTSAEQYYEYETTTYEKKYKLKYEVIDPTTGIQSQLLIIARDDGYVVGESIELPTDTIGVQEVIFTSDNNNQVLEDPGGDENRDDTGDNQGNENQEGDSRVFYPRTLIIGHTGGYDGATDTVRIDNVELYEVQELNTNTTTANEGLYTFGAQLLVGDFSGDDLINYTTEDLNPGDCADFQSGNPSNLRYWKNIIPQNYDITNREPLGTEQGWLDDYYYPVLPKYGNAGTFESANNQFYPGGDYDYPNDNTPFPIEGMVTEETSQEQSMIMNIYNKQDEPNVFIDGSGNDNNAFAMNDYKPKYNEQTSEPQSIKNVDRIRTSKDKGAF